MLPIGSWKKHGRTVPSASTTTDIHGALQLTGGNGAEPGERRVVGRQPPQAVGRLGHEARGEVVGMVDDDVCSTSVGELGHFRWRESARIALATACVPAERRRRRSAARNEMPSRPIARAWSMSAGSSRKL